MPSLLVVVGVWTSISDLGNESSSHLRTVRHARPSPRSLFLPTYRTDFLVEHVNLKVRDALGRGIVVNPSYTVGSASHRIPIVTDLLPMPSLPLSNLTKASSTKKGVSRQPLSSTASTLPRRHSETPKHSKYTSSPVHLPPQPHHRGYPPKIPISIMTRIPHHHLSWFHSEMSPSPGIPLTPPPLFLPSRWGI